MAKYTGDFKRQIAAEIVQGGQIREVATRHGIARNSQRRVRCKPAVMARP